MTEETLLKETYAHTHRAADVASCLWRGVEQGQPVTAADATQLLDLLRKANVSALQLSEIIHQKVAR